jgi:MOSC domain-containing protein YiiM
MAGHDAPMQLLGVQVGRAERLQIGDQWVLSGIRKRGVAGPVAVRALGLAGDEQADLSVHGGLSKAVYAYPVEHYDFWREQQRALGRSPELPFGTLGENLAIRGLLETSVFVGDVLKFPDCVLRVTQPRMPCFKFVAVMGDRHAARKMVRTGFFGFYLAVDTPGSIQAGQSFELMKGPRETPLTAMFPRGRAGAA